MLNAETYRQKQFIIHDRFIFQIFCSLESRNLKRIKNSVHILHALIGLHELAGSMA